MQQADRHGVIPLLWDQLHKMPQGSVPQEVVDYFRSASGVILRHNLALTAELIAILDSLADAGMQGVPFKGPVLAVSAYGSLALRSFADLDILIPLPDLDRAVAVLEARGFEPAVAADTQYVASECQLRLSAPNGPVVELHWRLMEKNFSCPEDMEGLWRRMTTIELAGKSMPALGHEDLLLYLCLHGAKHQWDRLEWICSVAELMRRPSTDWSEIRSRARRLGCVRALYLGLYLANCLLGVPLPGECRGEVLANRAVRQLATRVCESINRESAPSASPARRIAHYYFLMRCRERLADKWRIAWYSCARTPHPESKEFFVLPQPLRFLYYVLRPMRLAGECAILAWRWCLK